MFELWGSYLKRSRAEKGEMVGNDFWQRNYYKEVGNHATSVKNSEKASLCGI